MANPRILERLRKSRTELSQSELAAKLGMSISTYRRMIEGSAPFTMETIHKASKFFNVEEDVILERVPFFPEPDKKVPTEETMMIVVTLDGTKKKLDFWIRRLTLINQSL